MKNTIRLFGIIFLVAFIGFSFVACEGPMGPAGQDGKDGVNGQDGKDGIDGVDGQDGIDGKDAGGANIPADYIGIWDYTSSGNAYTLEITQDGIIILTNTGTNGYYKCTIFNVFPVTNNQATTKDDYPVGYFFYQVAFEIQNSSSVTIGFTYYIILYLHTNKGTMMDNNGIFYTKRQEG